MPIRIRASLIALVVVICVAGAAPAITHVDPIFDIRLDAVQIAVRGKKGSSKTVHEFRTPERMAYGAMRSSFEDGAILFSGEIWPANVLISVQNRTAGVMRVLWSEASFVDSNGDAHPVVHESKASFDERGERELANLSAAIHGTRTTPVARPDESPSQTSSIIPEARANEYIYPADFVAAGHRKALLPEGGRLLGIPERNEPSLDELKADVQKQSGAWVGKTFKLYLPVDTGDGTLDYMFTFRIVGVELRVQ